MKYTYVLLSNTTGRRLELEKIPIGWDETKNSILRDFKYFGLFTGITANFRFTHDGYNFLLEEYINYGVDFDVILRVYKNRKFYFEGKINTTDFEIDLKLKTFKVDLIESSFIQKFKNRDKVKLNLFNNYSVDGDEINPAGTVNATLSPHIFKLYSEADNEGATPQDFSHSVPFNFITNDNIQVRNSYTIEPEADKFVQNIINNPDAAVYLNSKEVAQEIRFTLDLDVTVSYIGDKGAKFLSIYEFMILKVNENNQYTFIEDFIWKGDRFGRWQKSFDHTLTLEPKERLLICWFQNTTNDWYGQRVTYNKIDFKVYEASTFAETPCKCILPFELFTNLIAQMTGVDNALVSNVFGRTDIGYASDGAMALQSVTKGTLLRGKEETDVAISFEKAFQSFNVKGNLGVLVKGNKVYIDPKDMLFENVIIDIGEVSEMTIKPAEEFYFNQLKIGYPTKEYEELNGADEFNTTVEYVNDLKAYGRDLEIVSEIRGDGTGIELARRKPVETSGTEDTRYDNDLFFICLTRSGSSYRNQKSGDDGLVAGGVFSPETAYNLAIAPSQCAANWKRYLGIPLVKNVPVYYYQTKDFNSSLWVDTGNNYTKESDNLTADDYYFYPEIRSFNKPVSTELLKSIKDHPLAILKYTYKNRQYYDYLYEVSAEDSDVGNFKVLASSPMNLQSSQIDFSKLPVLKYDDGEESYLLSDDNEHLLYE